MGWTRWNGRQILSNAEAAAITAVEKTANIVNTVIQTQVPLDEGFLSRSGVVIIKHEEVPIAIISYGGGPGTGHPKIPYAIRWHEMPANFQHGRKNKYIKDPFDQLAAKTLQSVLAHELRSIL